MVPAATIWNKQPNACEYIILMYIVDILLFATKNDRNLFLFIVGILEERAFIIIYHVKAASPSYIPTYSYKTGELSTLCRLATSGVQYNYTSAQGA